MAPGEQGEGLAERATQTLNTFLTALGALLCVWAVLLWIYFVRCNHGLLHDPNGNALGLLGGLFGHWSFSMALTPPGQVIAALIVAAMTVGLGMLCLRGVDVRLPLYAELALAWPVGLGVSGIAFELLTMAGLLYPIPSWLLWAVLFGGFGWLAKRRASAPPWLDLFGKHERQATREDFVRLHAASPPLLFHFPRERYFWAASVALIVLITAAVFWHALFFPETYWDSLILYLGYARMTFLQHAFPFKAEAQVGIGLGANYPHLYSLYGSMASTLFDSWSDLHQRLAAPLAGLAASVLVYNTVREIWRNDAIAAAATLLFRAAPHSIYFTTTASDYAFAILFMAAFLYTFARFMRTRQPGDFIVLTALPAMAMHLNFLMGIMWVPWTVGLVFYARTAFPDMRLTKAALRPLKRGFSWAVFLSCLALASTWHIRNIVLTGNPVYAFFPNIFTSSIRVNPEVLKSAELEWFAVGDGIGVTAEIHRDIEEKRGFRDRGAPDFKREATLRDRLGSSFLFWIGFESYREDRRGELLLGSWFQRVWHLLRVWDSEQGQGSGEWVLRWPHAYKLSPLFPGFFFPAVIALLFFPIAGREDIVRFRENERPRAAVILVAGVLALLLLMYMYLLADFYLYQIIGILAPVAVLCSGLLAFFRYLPGRGRVLYYVMLGLVVAQGVFPGVYFSLMNFKFSSPGVVDGQLFRPDRLDAFRNPGMDPSIMMRLRFGDDVAMWNHVNEHLKGEKLLTHENRHYVLDPSITLVHLDDWDIQQAYGMAPEAVAAYLAERGITHYLRIPNEAKHRVNSRLGMGRLESSGLLEELFRSGDNVLYGIKVPE